MKRQYLFPAKCQKIGWVLMILGGLLVGFSKEKQEDELIVALRERSLVWAMIVGYFVLIFLYLFIYGYAFLYVMRFIVDLFLILYIIKFKIELYRLKRQDKDEK
jgi:membrane protein YdbS with pleckstrin-like domain